MVTSIVSVLTGIPVRRDIAMTGEVSLRGNAMPIGGLKEKLLAALRGGIKTVLIPQENEKDLAEIPDNVKDALNIIPVTHVSEVLERALVRAPDPIEWDESLEKLAQLVGSATGPVTLLFGGRVSTESIGWALKMVEGKAFTAAMKVRREVEQLSLDCSGGTRSFIGR